MLDIRLDVLVNLLTARADLYTLTAGYFRPDRFSRCRDRCLRLAAASPPSHHRYSGTGMTA